MPIHSKTKLPILIALAVFLSSLSNSCVENKKETVTNTYTYKKHKQQLQYFDSEDGKMAYLDTGSGSVILLVHGVPTSSWLYRKMIPILTEQGFRVVVPDMLGYGASDKPDDPEKYTPEKMGKRLLQLMEHLKIKQWSQVFHDGGGLWTWEMLKADASKVNHLFMLNTIVYESGFKPPIRFTEGKIAKTYAKQYTTKMGQTMVINPTFGNGIKNSEMVTDGMLEGYKTPFLDQGSAALYYFFTRTCNHIPDYTALHRSLHIPLTVIWGKDDDMLVWEGIEEQVKTNFKIKEEAVFIIDAKHFIQEEQPNFIVETIINRMK